jgi:hypothetical protein
LRNEPTAPVGNSASSVPEASKTRTSAEGPPATYTRPASSTSMPRPLSPARGPPRPQDVADQVRRGRSFRRGWWRLRRTRPAFGRPRSPPGRLPLQAGRTPRRAWLSAAAEAVCMPTASRPSNTATRNLRIVESPPRGRPRASLRTRRQNRPTVPTQAGLMSDFRPVWLRWPFAPRLTRDPRRARTVARTPDPRR